MLRVAPDWYGAADDWSDFRPADPIVVRLHQRFPGLRLARTQRIWDSLIAAVIEQLVTGEEAHRAWRTLLWRAGEPAPGPRAEQLRVPPTPRAILDLTDWQWHAIGLDGARRRTLRAVATVAGQLETGVTLAPDAAAARLRVVPGVGVWTAAETLQRALGDPDSVSVGDFHIPSLVGYTLTGERTDDAGMLELLEPFRPHRQRVVRLIEVGGTRPPRRGPRAPVRNYRGF